MSLCVFYRLISAVYLFRFDVISSLLCCFLCEFYMYGVVMCFVLASAVCLDFFLFSFSLSLSPCLSLPFYPTIYCLLLSILSGFLYLSLSLPVHLSLYFSLSLFPLCQATLLLKLFYSHQFHHQLLLQFQSDSC